MPKLKKKSVAQKLREDKKRQEANTAARRLARQDPERRRKEQEANTAARRLARQDPERRRKEQEANTAVTGPISHVSLESPLVDLSNDTSHDRAMHLKFI
jgi:hypothetical protein